MIKSLKLRWLLGKRRFLNRLFWLSLPVLASLLILAQVEEVEENIQIPIAVVLEEESDMVNDLLQALEDSPHLKLERLSEGEALRRLERHELDSVYVIHRNYEKKLAQGRRQHLVTAYQSNLSFAYAPVTETVLSFIQQDFIRMETVRKIAGIHQAYQVEEDWPEGLILEQGKRIELEQELLRAQLEFLGNGKEGQADSSRLNIWVLWGWLSLLSTFMLFDWVLRERQAPVLRRLYYSQWSPRSFFRKQWLLLTALLLLVDGLGVLLLGWILSLALEGSMLMALIVFRLSINTLIFYFTYLFSQPFSYYVAAFALVLLALLFSGLILPFQRDWLALVHPVLALEEGRWLTLGGIISLLLWLLSLLRKGEYHVTDEGS